MENYYFMRRAQEWLAVPRNFRRLIAVTLRVVATLIVPLSLVIFFKAGKVIFELPASGILGGILFQMFFIVAVYCMVHGLFVRAKDIDQLPPSEFHMLALSATVIKALGESLAAFIAFVAVGGGVYVWFTGKRIGTILNPLPDFLPVFANTTFVGGIQLMVGGVLGAIVLLGLAYLTAQLLQVVEHVAARVPSDDRSADSNISAVDETTYRFRSGTGT